MAQAQFPEVPDLDTDHFGDGHIPKVFSNYTLSNPHPGFGKDPNILNEYGHTKYPMAIGSEIAHNAMEEAQIRDKSSEPKAAAEPLREDGPTIHEYVAANYPASTYPPKGYASKSTPEEIDEAIKAEAAKGWGTSSGWK
jgi:hypothetical protein